jgi:hypothetical protein
MLRSDVVVAHEQGKILHADFNENNPEQRTLLILKGGGGYLVREYWVQAEVFHVLTTDGEHKMFPVSRLDLEETVRINRERNVEFVLRTPEASQP